MRANPVAAAVVVSLSCLTVMASCAQHGPAVGEDEEGRGGAPAVALEDEDPDFGSGIGSEPPSGVVGSDPYVGSESPSSGPGSAPSGPAFGAPSEGPSVDDPKMFKQCIALADAGMARKEAFCNTFTDNGVRGRCWKNRWSRLTWIGWCNFEFTD